MDNVCHTLVGLAAARAGLNRTTALATATLAISANLPDIDVLSFLSGTPAVAHRRGHTHGVIAQIALPIVCGAAMWAIGRWRTRKNGSLIAAPSSTHPASRIPHPGWLILLSYVGVLSHVYLDYLNTYGVRLLMPFSGRWFYGDSVFIIDVWIWLLLAAGVVLARRGRMWPARAGLIAATAYIVVMLISADRARAIVESRWTETFGRPPEALMVGPVPINPLRRSIIADAGDRYILGEFRWQPRGISFNRTAIAKNDEGPWVAVAMAQEPDFAGILVWSRFPFWVVEPDAGGMRVTLRDARFPSGIRGFAATTYVRKEVVARLGRLKPAPTEHPPSPTPHPGQ